MNELTSMSRNVTVEILEPIKRQTINVPVQEDRCRILKRGITKFPKSPVFTTLNKKGLVPKVLRAHFQNQF